MQRNTITSQKCRKQCMQILPTFLTNGLLAGLLFHYVLLLAETAYFAFNKLKSKFYEFTSFKICLWFVDSEVLLKNWKDSEISVLPIYKELIAAGLKIWVFRYSFKLFLYMQLYHIYFMKVYIFITFATNSSLASFEIQ